MAHENVFETGARKIIPAVLIYVRFQNEIQDEILMLHRNAVVSGKVDYHAGKWNGLGGKLDADESPWEAARRELREETTLDLAPEAFSLLGVLQFPNFKAHKNEDWVVWVFTARANEAQRRQELRGPEGDLHWIPAGDLLKLNLWAGDKEFIPHVVAERRFDGTIWYQGETVLRAEMKRK